MSYLKIFIVLAIGCLAFILSNGFANQLDPIKAEGIVNRNEVGGQDLKVISIWDAGKSCRVAADGTFTTVISNLRPQKLSVVDSFKMTRALAISLPDRQDKIIFDANSTACAILFRDSASFGQTSFVENFRKLIASKLSFQALETFLRENLSTRSLEEIVKDNAFTSLMDDCAKEIFNEDKEAINVSLHAAQKALQKSLQ